MEALLGYEQSYPYYILVSSLFKKSDASAPGHPRDINESVIHQTGQNLSLLDGPVLPSLTMFISEL